jgi:hypothetical protein
MASAAFSRMAQRLRHEARPLQTLLDVSFGYGGSDDATRLSDTVWTVPPHAAVLRHRPSRASPAALAACSCTVQRSCHDAHPVQSYLDLAQLAIDITLVSAASACNRWCTDTAMLVAAEPGVGVWIMQ